MSWFDTHCHIHDTTFAEKFGCTSEELFQEAQREGIDHVVCVGTDVPSSIEAVALAKAHPVTGAGGVIASVALHPHEAVRSKTALQDDIASLENLCRNGGVTAIGECGLDYFYHKEPEIIAMQQWLLREHLALAARYNLPLIFHIRDAFDDFFTILDDSEPIRGVVHSFTSDTATMKKAVARGLYIGLNGIITFSKDQNQLDAAREVPLSHLVLETDAPFLTPSPFRGTICKPQHVLITAEFLADLRDEPRELLESHTTANARQLFGIDA